MDLFEGPSIIKTLIETLSARTDLNALKKYTPFSEEDKNQKLIVQKEFDEKLIASKSKEKEIGRLSSIKQLLLTNKQAVSNINAYFTDDIIKRSFSAIEDYINKEKIAQKEGYQNFATENIKEIGSQEWKSFIQAAEKFALLQTEEYPIDGDKCILCHQTLSPEAQALINNYWLFIKSVAENEVKSAQEVIDKGILSYQKLNFTIFPEENTLAAWLLEIISIVFRKI